MSAVLIQVFASASRPPPGESKLEQHSLTPPGLRLNGKEEQQTKLLHRQAAERRNFGYS